MANPYPATFIDQNAEGRLVGEMDFTDPANRPGGSQPYVGAALVTAGTVNVGKNGAVLPFNHVDHDSDSFWDAANHRFVIPAGKGGVYHYGFALSATMDAAATTYMVALASITGNANNLRAYTDYPNLDSDDYVGIAAAGVGVMNDGDTMTLLFDFYNGVDINTLGLEPYTNQMFVSRQGDIPT